jgi:hypothetical protein
MFDRGRAPGRPRALTEDQVQDVLASVGVERVVDTAARLGVHYATILRVRKAHGVARSAR